MSKLLVVLGLCILLSWYLDVVATVDKQELTLGDSFECEYRVYTDIDVKEMSNNSFKIDNSFWYYTDSLKTKTMEIKRYKGMNSRSVLWAKLKITPLKTGKIVIPSMPFLDSSIYPHLLTIFYLSLLQSTDLSK